MRVHHSSAHGEKLPNRECANCGTAFYSEHERKYCGETCRDTTVSFEGSNNPNYRGGKATGECEICGASFEYYPSGKPGIYCSSCVESENWRHRPDMSGENSHRWNGGPVELACDICESTFHRHPNAIDSDVTFCSRECQYEWLSESFTGEGHPNWEGGDTGPYGPGWNRIRRLALERDEYECVLCGTSKEALGRNPDVHHITPVRRFAGSDTLAVADAHDLANVVSLCVDCHRKEDFGIYENATLRDAIGVGVP